MPGPKSTKELEIENRRLREEVSLLQRKLKLQRCETRGAKLPTDDAEFDFSQDKSDSSVCAVESNKLWTGVGHNLSKGQIERYSRQILLGSMGVGAQALLSKASVLIIGAGGLGCPAAIYLAACGIGCLGIADKDHVELSNLHRQILHTEAGVGMHKADSAAAACRALNSSIEIRVFRDGFLPHNALQIAEQFDIVVDASDNVPTRYLISDVCCVLGRPLVSGAAIGTEGQLTVYCHNDGVIGTLQALEVVKIATGVGIVGSQVLLLADFLSGHITRVKLRGRQSHCISCGLQPEVTKETLPDYDYRDLSGQDYNDRAPADVQLAQAESRIGAKAFLSAPQGFQVLDVRPSTQFKAAHIPGSLNLPYNERNPLQFRKDLDFLMKTEGCPLKTKLPVVVLCRRGNDSQVVAQILSDDHGIPALDLEGGLTNLSQCNSFPML